jgi:hypothetical protein
MGRHPPQSTLVIQVPCQGFGLPEIPVDPPEFCQRPDGVVILKVADLKLSLPLALVWRRDNLSPLLSRFVTDVGSLVKARPTAR